MKFKVRKFIFTVVLISALFSTRCTDDEIDGMDDPDEFTAIVPGDNYVTQGEIVQLPLTDFDVGGKEFLCWKI